MVVKTMGPVTPDWCQNGQKIGSANRMLKRQRKSKEPRREIRGSVNEKTYG